MGPATRLGGAGGGPATGQAGLCATCTAQRTDTNEGPSTMNKQQGKYDNGKCFVCGSPGTPGEQLVESRWRIHRIWLCPEHELLVAKRMRHEGWSRDVVLDEIVDAVRDGLGLYPAGERPARRDGPRTAEQLREDEEDRKEEEENQKNREYMDWLRQQDSCAVCTMTRHEGQELSEHQVNGESVFLCARDEAAVQRKVEEGLGWPEAIHQAGVDLMNQIMPPGRARQIVDEHLERKRNEPGHEHD